MTARDRGEPRGFALALAAIAVAALALRALGLASAPLLGDDVTAGASAINFVERGGIGPTMWQHPRLRDVLVYASLAAGTAPKLRLALPSLALGVAAVPLLGLLGRRLAGPQVGLLAAALLAIDPLHVAYSRQAIQEVYTSAFAIAGVLLVARHVATGARAPLVGAGLVFGLGLATKWSLAFPLALSLAWTVLDAARARDVAPGVRAARAGLAVAALGAVPVAVYAATWAPWILAGHDLGDLVELHRLLAREVAAHGGFNPATLEMPHQPARWFLAPVWYADFTMGAAGPVPYVTVTNPGVWLLVLPAAAAAAHRAVRRRDAGLGVLIGGFAATYAPFLAARRPIWVHSALVVLPFALLLVAALVWRAAEATSRPARWAVAYLAVASLAAAPLYLAATGHGLEVPGLRAMVEAARPAVEADRPAP